MLKVLRTLADNDRVCLYPSLRQGPVDEVLEDAIDTFGMYHARAACERGEQSVIVRDPKLLYFYGNRLEPWAADLRDALR